MDPEELSKKYMKQYDELITDFKAHDIDNKLEELNMSIAKSNKEKTNEIYSKLMDWNMRVANLGGVRNSLNAQYSYLHLPSPALYAIIFDAEEQEWKYNTHAV